MLDAPMQWLQQARELLPLGRWVNSGVKYLLDNGSSVFDTIGGGVEASQGQWNTVLEVRNTGPEQQGNRLGPCHSLSLDAPSAGAGN